MSDEIASSVQRGRRSVSDAIGALSDAVSKLIALISAEGEDDNYNQIAIEHLAELAISITRLLADVRKLDEAPPAGDGTLEGMTPELRAAALRQLLAEEASIPAPLVVAAGRRMGQEWCAAVVAALGVES